MEMLQGVWKQHLRPRAVVGYRVKIFLPSPPNYVTRSPGVIEWLCSYLDERCQRILINTTQSSSLKLNFGIPQGSCLVPLLFTVQASKLFDVVKHHLPTVHCYADDTQLYVSFSPNDETGQDEAVAAVQRCVDDIRLWMTTDKLLLNDDKTEFVVIGTKPQLAKVQLNDISIGQCEITPTSSVRNLGVWFDSTLSVNSRINKTCSLAFYYLYNIRKIRKYSTCLEKLLKS